MAISGKTRVNQQWYCKQPNVRRKETNREGSFVVESGRFWSGFVGWEISDKQISSCGFRAKLLDDVLDCGEAFGHSDNVIKGIA